MGHAKTSDMLNDFKKAHKDLDIVNNLVQLSMDGPNVNWSMHRVLDDFRKEENPSAPSLIVIGSCGLHVVYGAYQTGHRETDWDVDKTLKVVHGVFKKSPARRSDYLSANDIKDRNEHNAMKSLFPLKFCGHWWLENGKAIARYLEISDKLYTFLTRYKEKKEIPTKR